MPSAFSRRFLFTGSAAAGMALGLPPLARAQSFPQRGRPIRAVIPFSTGGSVDVWARPCAQMMSEILQTNVVVDNRAGANGAIGVQAVKSAPRDGYTLLFTSLSTQVVGPHLFKQSPYDPQADFIPLVLTMRSPMLAFAGPSFPFRTASEFFAAAKDQPGKYTFGSISATTRISGEMLTGSAGIKMLNVPYKNFIDLINDLISGRIDLYMSDVASIMPFFSHGVRALGAASLTRLAVVPDVPTLDEQGLTGFQIGAWSATYAPAGTPGPVVAILRDAIRRAMGSPSVVDALTRVGAEPMDLAGDDLAAFQKAEYEKWGEAIRGAGLAGTL